ncbi:hypothetical protein [Enterocloster citroniae]|uniref:hypothetical protein n=1 Tax=Enterocloster citroniae TaxID=358743 RepID=UPI0018988DDA|nr:hypothetical protein [Enterocloster citroniae]
MISQLQTQRWIGQVTSNNVLVPKDEAEMIFCEGLNAFLTESLTQELLKKEAS